MKCKGCGVLIPEKYLQLEAFRCPNCGKSYRRVTSSSSRTTGITKQAAGAYRNKQTPRSRNSISKSGNSRRRSTKNILLRRLWKFPVYIWLGIIIVILLLTQIKKPIREEINDTTQTMAASVAVDESSETWEERFSENETAVISYIKDIVSPYRIRSVGEDLLLTLDYNLTEPDVYYADIDLIISPASVTGVKAAIQSIESNIAANTEHYNVGFRIVFMQDDNKSICLAAFGVGFSGYSFVVEGNRTTYTTLEEIPDTLFDASIQTVTVESGNSSGISVLQGLVTDWNMVTSTAKLYLLAQDSLSFVTDIDYSIKEDQKTIYATAVVKDGTSPENALELATILMTTLNESARTKNENIAPTDLVNNYYGGLFDEYTVFIGISQESTINETSKWYVYHVVTRGMHARQMPKLQ